MMSHLFVRLCLVGGIFCSSLAHATENATENAAASSSAAVEAKVLAISQDLRCLVCQNQSVADSNAELAQDLRQLVREKLRQGQSEAQIIAFLKQRYGDFVSYKPPMQMSTWLLWLGPFVALLFALQYWRVRMKQQALSLKSPNSPNLAADNPLPSSIEVLSQPASQSASKELERSSAKQQRWQLLALGGVILFAALLLYTQLGTPQALSYSSANKPAAKEIELSEAELQQRVEQIQMLLMQANSKAEQQDYAGALQAWQKVEKLVAPNSALAAMAAQNIAAMRKLAVGEK
jgi:cytochrome c-type biogenesis protein CcmH